MLLLMVIDSPSELQLQQALPYVTSVMAYYHGSEKVTKTVGKNSIN